MKRKKLQAISKGVGVVSFTALLVACSGPTPSQAPKPVDASAFAGTWIQHGGHTVIQADGSIDMVYQVFGAGPQGTAFFPHLALQIVSVTGTTATAQVRASNDPQAKEGATFTIRKAEPGLIITSAQDERDWCDDEHEAKGICGV